MTYPFEALGPTLRVVTLVFLIVFALVALGLLVLLAALPGRLAKRRGHPQAEAIQLCGWLGLPTGILWIVAMVWATLRTSASAGGQLATGTAVDRQLTALEQAVSQLETTRAGASS
jgi:hypothetical protein